MSPRPGGEADKFGNRFEGRWTVRQVLDVLAGRAVSITVEEVGEGGEGVEFSLVRNDGTVEAHQVKRQRGNANGWSVRNLEKENVLANATKQVELGRQFHFVSIIPSRKLDELADRARRSDDGQAFVNGLSAELGQEFNVFKAAVGSADYAFKVLRSLFMRMQDEREVRATNAVLAGRFIGGAPAPTAAVVLGDLVQENLGCTMDLATIRGKLAEYELHPAELIGVAEVGETVRRVYEGWQGTIERELLDPEISRPEADEIGAALRSGGRTIVLAAGDAGAGKSAVLRQALSGLDDQWPVLGLRLDRIEPFSSPHELGVDRLGLPASPVASLAAVAGDNECLLVVDQLDAVSRASGRMPLMFDAVAELVREAAAFPSMRVLLACRQFDIDNDDRLRRLVTDEDKVIQVTVPTLSEEQVAGAVGAMGLAPAVLTGPQRELLGSPLHLVLLSAIADQDEALTFTSSKDLLDAFWDRKRQDCNARREVRFADTIGALVDYMSENQRLAAPEAILDAGELRGDADLLASEHVLVRDERKIAFFHEAFFDYAFARRWIIRGETLVEFLRSGEQELFRRAQVRQVLAHLRDDDPGRFIAEVDALLSDVEIRFHIKEVVLAIVRRIANPTTAEWRLVERLLDDDPPFAARLWSGLRTEAWFARLDAQGAIEQWLAGEETDLHARALEIMVSAPKQSAGRHAEPHVGRADFAGWLRWIVRFADLEQSRALFELVLDAVRTGRYTDSARELWLSAHSLGSKEPDWACELVAAWLRERPSALSLDDEGKIVALEDRDYQLQEIIKQAVAGAPGAFSRAVVPYLLAAMALTADGERRPRRDRHFGYRSWDSDPHDVGDALQLGARDALRALAAGDDAALDELLPMLASDEHDGAQWLLYEALIAAAPTRAEWAAQRLLEGEHRLASGYICSPYWTTRQLLEVIGPAVGNETFAELEALCTNFAPDWETPPGGYSQFTLHSALPEDRLSEPARRRLGELRRRFGREQPNEPMGIHAGAITSPIPQAAAQYMSDQDWLSAIAKYDSDEHDWSSFTGGAEQLGNVLEEETKADPGRFARLCLQLDGATHPAYINAIMRGLGNVDTSVDPQLVFDAVRHAARLGRSEHDRWIPWGLSRQVSDHVPDDVIELVLDRALHSPDPTDDLWLVEASGGDRYYGGDPSFDGMNTARGAACLILGDLLVHDADGRRTSLVVDAFPEVASDPIICVRTCAAHLLAAGLRHARPEVVAAFQLLVDADDRLLAAKPVGQLILNVGFGDPEVVRPVIERMLDSVHREVREVAGRLAAFAGLELGLGDLLERARGADPASRKGAARLCAHRLPLAGDGAAAADALRTFFDDNDDDVREAAAEVAGALRGRDLPRHASLLEALIDSPAFTDAVPQLLITLDEATERVDELVLLAARRFLDVYSGQLDTIATAAAGDAQDVGGLVLRAYAQATNADGRRRALDLIDELLAQAAYGFSERVGEAER